MRIIGLSISRMFMVMVNPLIYHLENLGCMVISLKCLYTNPRSMGSKQELEICVSSEGHDLIAITEVWLDSSHD